MEQVALRAVFMRGGTSKAVMLRAADLPQDRARWDAIFRAVIGSPDPNRRQLDGMGGGVSSLSKVCVLGPPSRPDADIDYTFAQIGVGDDTVDYASNCGNMSSAVGPYAVEEGLVPRPNGSEATVRIHNTNTAKIIVSRFRMANGQAAVEGDLALDGVAGTGAPIRLDFTDPAGSRTGRLLPTGRAVDTLEVAGLGPVRASLVDAANPCVFVPAEALGATATELPDAIEADGVLTARLEAIRRRASVLMGLAPDEERAAAIPSVPKIGLVAAPADMTALSGRGVAAAEIDILVRMVSMGQAHRAVPLTAALCLAVACRTEGSVANGRVRADAGMAIRIGHPSGRMLVDADVRPGPDGPVVPAVTVYRTARRLFQGEVLYRASLAG